MNSDDTNKIEGQHTRPADIERALHQHFDADEPSDCGVLEAETSRAKVHFAVPFKSLRFLFPRL